ncbi:MAG TPA: MBL fold metallo-hydrolase [Luteolibacter sp.]|nr:MBL fold metallo-hydrolase [Luteolibacter sp.]
MLEDDFTYVFRKVLRGLALSPTEAAKRAGLPESEVLAFSRGRFSAETARKLASALGLAPEAFASHPDYEPAIRNEPFLSRLVLPFGDEHVNAWLVSSGNTHLLFDTGDDPHSCADALEKPGVGPTTVFITHGHPDHTAGLPAFSGEKFGPEIPGASPLHAGETLQRGDLTIRTIDLSGHFNPSVGYLIEGFDKPLLVAGDAIFAGSIGGCDPDFYQPALDRIRAAVTSLDPETIILPGHGPATTVGEEMKRNPFFTW